MCRLLVVDDHEPVRRGIQTLLGSRKGWFVCGEAADRLQAVKQAKLLRPDLIIVDVSMPKMNGLDAARIILREVPGSRPVHLPAMANHDLSRSLLWTIGLRFGCTIRDRYIRSNLGPRRIGAYLHFPLQLANAFAHATYSHTRAHGLHFGEFLC